MPIYEFSQDFLTSMTKDSTEKKAINPVDCPRGDFRALISYFVVKTVGDVSALRQEVDDLKLENSNLQESVNTVVTENLQLREELDELKVEDGKKCQLLKEIQGRLDALELTKASVKQDMLSDRNRVLNLERHSRSKNLRFVLRNKETERENTTKLLTDELSKHGINVRIEHSHRVGKIDTASLNPRPRQIIAAFLERPERFKVINKRRELFTAGIQVYDDLCATDFEEKKRHKDFMQSLYQKGKRVQFVRGCWLVDNVKFSGIEDPDLYT